MSSFENSSKASEHTPKFRVYAQPPDSDVLEEIGGFVASLVEEFPQMNRVGSIGSEFSDDDRQTHMRLRWEESMQQNMEFSNEYERVGVFIIKWADELDELKTRNEVDQLERLFRDKFNYEAQVLELESSPIPQHQLSCGVSGFAKEFDSEQTRNLMIVYYTGNGEWHDLNGEDGLLYLSPKKHQYHARGQRIPKACWNSTERTLLDARGDVLTIFDSCFASNLTAVDVASNVHWTDSNENPGVFEQLSATGFDEITPLPGKDSFTTALISSLEELLGTNQNHHFSTFQLQQKITKARPSKAPWLSNRLMREWDRHIRLGPLKESDSSEQWHRPPNPESSFLFLKFELDKTQLEDEEIDGFTKVLAQACRDSPIEIRGVDWHDLRRRRLAPIQMREAVAKVQRTNRAIRRFSQALSNPENATKSKHQASDASLDERNLARARTSPLSPKDEARNLSRDDPASTIMTDHLSPNPAIHQFKTW